MRRRKSINSKLDYRGKKRYKRKKDVIYKKREERKPKQKEGK
jgi:hypothetical protein